MGTDEINQQDLAPHTASVPGSGFRYVYWAAAVVAGITVLVAITAVLLPTGNSLHDEDGPLETLSILFWVTSLLISFGTACRPFGPASRFMAMWTGWIAVLAALRELDLHIRLNPKHLGSLGVRYRLDWWLSGEVNPWLKLGWATLFLTAFLLLFYPPLKLRGVLMRLLRQGDPLVGLIVLSTVFLGGGFVIDDLLRPVQFVSLPVKQLVEETSELIGAVLFCFSMILQWRHPLAMRITPGWPGTGSAKF
jgi:hypothetical protein